MRFSATLSLATSLRLSSVKSFQLVPTSAIVSTKKIGAATLAVVPKPRSSAPSPLFALFFTDDPQAELEEIKQKYANVTESLEQAKKRQDDAQQKVDLIREEQVGVDSETEQVISRLKRDFSEEMADLSDAIEGAQDDLRRTMSKTRSEISNIRGEVHEREERLYSEISDLESRLAALRKDAKKASKERDAARNSIRRDERGAGAASRKDIEEAKREASREKKELTVQSWELENRIQQAKLDAIPAKRELEEAKRQDATLPSISSLKGALLEMKRKMLPQVEDMKEKLAAGEMFFDQSFNKVRKDKKSELEAAKSAYERDIAAEDRKLENATSNYKAQVEASEKELERNSELASEPVYSAGFGALADAESNRVALYREKIEAVSKMKDAKRNAVREAVESRSAIQDQYDAEYENGQRRLNEQDARGKRRLQEEDGRREKRKVQLRTEMEELTKELSSMMHDERAVAEEDYQYLKQTKSTELTDSISRSNGASNEIQKMRSNVKLVEYELNTLEYTSKQHQDTLSELEEERTSFRKQARRTMSVAIGRITRRGSRADTGRRKSK